MIKKFLLLFILTPWILFPTFTAFAENQTIQSKQNQNNAKTKHHRLHHTHKQKSNAKKNKKKHHKQQHTVAIRPNLQSATEQAAVVEPSYATTTFVAAMERRLIEFVHKTVSSIRYSIYKLGGKHFDTSNGVYIVDCSNYVDNVLQEIYPRAYSNLVNWSGSESPTSNDYYHFFTNLSGDPQHYWNTVEDVPQLRPGDVLVFRYKNMRGRQTGGHVMIVMSKPIQDNDSFLVRVADSAPAGHSQDTRSGHVSGIGIGNLLLKVNPKTYQPFAFAWKVGANWKRNVNFAMARPVDLKT